MTIQDFFAAIRQRWRIIVATLLLVLSVTALITWQTPKVYGSSTRVYLLASQESSTGNLYNMPAAEKETLVQVASSPVVVDGVREQLGYDDSVPISISASVAGDTTLLDGSATSDTPQRAADIATAVPQVLASVARNFAPSLAQSGQAVEAQVISPASTSSLPVEPDLVTNLLMAVLAGLLLGVIFALIRHNLDTRVRAGRDLAGLSERPVLAAIPVSSSGSGHDIYVESDPFGVQAEAVRTLRTNMLFVDVTTGGHSFMITSSLPGEGKTTTAVNLGLAMADSGLKVLLIDADLRHPSVAGALGLEGSVGLTTILLGAAEPDDVIQKWAGTNLHVLASGDIPPNPSELLGSKAMRSFFDRVSQDFDFVLVDTPPVLPVADPLVVSKLVGGTIMAVAAGSTRKRHLAEALRILGTADVEIGGFVLTKTPAQPNSYYSYYYGSKQNDEPHKPRSNRRRSESRTRRKRDRQAKKRLPNAQEAAQRRAARDATRESSTGLEHATRRRD